jgi:hypothetical protein
MRRSIPRWLTGSMLVLTTACSKTERIEAEPRPAAVSAVASPAPNPLPASVEPSRPPEPLARTFELTERERLILRHMLAEDYDVFAKGGDTLFGDSEAAKAYVVVSADELQNEYERKRSRRGQEVPRQASGASRKGRGD